VSEQLASISSPGMAAQFTLTKGRRRRDSGRDMAAARSSLPVARFADEQNAGIGAGGHGGLFDGALEGRADADHFGGRVRRPRQTPVLLLEGALFERVP